jgi:hypothetical protein
VSRQVPPHVVLRTKPTTGAFHKTRYEQQSAQAVADNFRPIRNYSSGMNGRGLRLTTWFALNSRTSPTSLVPVSPCMAPSCA